LVSIRSCSFLPTAREESGVSHRSSRRATRAAEGRVIFATGLLRGRSTSPTRRPLPCEAVACSSRCAIALPDGARPGRLRTRCTRGKGRLQASTSRSAPRRKPRSRPRRRGAMEGRLSCSPVSSSTAGRAALDGGAAGSATALVRWWVPPARSARMERVFRAIYHLLDTWARWAAPITQSKRGRVALIRQPRREPTSSS